MKIKFENIFLISLFSYPFFAGLSLFLNMNSSYFSLSRYILIIFSIIFLIKNIRFKFYNEFIPIIFFLFYLSYLIYFNYSDLLFLTFLISILLPCFLIYFIKFEIKNINYEYISYVLIFFIFFYILSYLYILSDEDVFKYIYLNSLNDELTLRGFRVGTLNLNPISLCMYCVVCYIFIGFSKVKFKLFFEFCLLMIIINTGSKGPFLSFIISTLVLIIFRNNNLKKTLIRFLIFTVIATILTKSLIDQRNDIIGRIYNIYDKSYNDYALEQRIEAYKKYLLNTEKKETKEISEVTNNSFHNIFLEANYLDFKFLIFMMIFFTYYFRNLYIKLNFQNSLIPLQHLFILFFIQSLFSGFLPREEFLFIFLALLASKNKFIVKKLQSDLK